MGYSALTDAEIAQDKFVTTTVMDKIQDNFAYLYSQGANLILPINGSFETDNDADGIPDNWTRSLYPGGAGGLYTTSPAHGAKAAYFTHPGGAANGGGYLDGDYIEVSQLQSLSLFYILWATAAGMKNEIRVRYYDKDKAYVSDVALYSSVANPASATLYCSQFIPAATARYIKIRIIGGFTDTDVAGTAYFDGLWLVPTVITALIKDANVTLEKMEYGSIMLLAEPTDGTEYSPGGASSYATYVKYSIYIPTNATILNMRARVKEEGTANHCRFKVGALISTLISNTGGTYVWRNATLDVSSLSGWQTLEIQLYSYQGSTYLQGYSFIWE